MIRKSESRFSKKIMLEKYGAGAISDRSNHVLLDEPHDREGLLTE
jgi:hypothetical protein